MGKKLVAFAIAVGFLGVLGSPALAVNKEGAKCTVAGKTVTVAGKKLVCVKVAKTLKWIAVSTPATTVAPTTTTTTAVAPTTTTTTVAADRTAPTVTLARNAGSSSSSTILFTVTGNEAINCATLSYENNVDFTFTRISLINSITQSSTTVCTISAQSTAERGATVARASILTAATTFAVSDTAGNAQTTLLGSPQQTWVLRT